MKPFSGSAMALILHLSKPVTEEALSGADSFAWHGIFNGVMIRSLCFSCIFWYISKDDATRNIQLIC